MSHATSRTLTDDERWHRVMQRDAGADGRFVMAVKTTGVYCRPSCPSRHPKRENVTFFDIPEAARLAGYRACRRCAPDAETPAGSALRMVRRVCRLVEDADEKLPTLDELAAETGVSPTHLQRTFTRVMGVSPRAYADTLRRGRLRALLKEGNGVADALYGAGYGSPSRLYEKADSFLGMTPASYAAGGAGVHLRYAVAPCQLGLLLLAASERGVAFIALGDDAAELEDELRDEFPEATLERCDGRLAAWTSRVVDAVEGRAAAPLDLPLDVRATAFRARVWQALCDIPKGETRTYGEIAAALGMPGAARAVGRACATNPVAVIIPCHRVVGADGKLTGYRWGEDRKRDLIETERGGRTETRKKAG